MTAPKLQYAGQRDPYAMTPEESQRARDMDRAWKAYAGVFHGGDIQWPLLWKEGKEPNPNVIINRCGPAVDTDVAWLFGESVKITANKAPKEAQAYIDQAWGVDSDDSSDDDKMSLLQELATNGAVTGCAFLKIVWDEASGQDFPQLVVLDSECVRVRTDPHNCKIPICYIIEYKAPDPGAGPNPDAMPGTFRQVIRRMGADGQPSTTGIPGDETTWEIADYFKGARSPVFTLMPPAEGKTNPTTWPYPWAPVDGCPHLSAPNSYWGRPRITRDAIHINEVICTVASDINKIAMRHGHPILFTVKPGSNQRSIRYEPGTIMEVSAPIQAVEAGGDLEHLMGFEEDLRADFDELTHVPAQAFGRQADIPRTPVSGVAIRLGYGPLIADVTKERRSYGSLVRRASQHMLALKQEAWGKFSIALGWQDPLPADDLQQAQVVQVATSAGVMSKKTGAEKMGLEWDTEQENMADEDADQLTKFARGQGMPPDGGQPPEPGQPGEPGQPPQPAGNPAALNAPAAVAARQAMASMAKG